MDNNNDLFNNCLKYKKIKFDINLIEIININKVNNNIYFKSSIKNNREQSLDIEQFKKYINILNSYYKAEFII